MLLIFTGLLIVRVAVLHFSDRIVLKSGPKIENLRRGYIKDSAGNILAISIETRSLFANPEKIEDPKKTALQLAEILQVRPEYIYSRLTLPRRFIWLRRKLPEATASRIEALKINGLGFKKEFKRMYPYETLASHIIGFTDIDNNGLSGIEFSQNDYLSGTADVENADINSLNYGFNINLTIDKNIQYIAEKYLNEAVTIHNAERGAVVITDVRNARILACAVNPAYNSNYYFRYTGKQRASYSVVQSFEPGSTMKIFSAAAWLESGRADMKKLYHGSGEIDIYDVTIRSTSVHGWITMFDAVRLSCNVSVIRAMQEIRKDELDAMLRKFGFGSKVCRDFPGESPGLLRPVNEWSGISKASISIGQEMSATSLQLAAAFGAVANGGVYIQPSLIDSIELNNGHKIQQFYPKSKGRIISRQNGEILRQMMKAVVETGTGKNAAVPGYEVAGKTGTAQISSSTGGYLEGEYTASFGGFAPYDDPLIAVVVVLDRPKGQVHGGEVAAPVFSKVVSEVLPLMGAGATSVTNIDPREISARSPHFDGEHMPDLYGYRLSELTPLFEHIQKKYAVQFEFSGSGVVTSQSPEAGTVLQKKQKIELHFR
ncbi:MAG: transpeptidase family protein [Spirochaetes bacterium]|nr:transpeptidase family protein [Spirochaetota bacterium]MBN2769652.1 transpeptidase family protein [Spirochaetota bacterium]